MNTYTKKRHTMWCVFFGLVSTCRVFYDFVGVQLTIADFIVNSDTP